MNIPDITSLKGPQFTEKHFKFHYPEFLEFLNEKYKDTELTFQEKLYWYFNDIAERPVCMCCGKETKFENALKGYRNYCSYKCLNSDPNKIKKVEKTCLERFGTKAPAQNRSVVYKMEQTNLKRFGTKNAMENPDIAKKSRDNYIEKYGAMGNASEIVLKKYKETSQEKYGADNYASTQECKDRIKDTCINKYGVDSYSKTPKFCEQIIKHNQEKYGTNSYTQTDEYKEKTFQTNLDKYGVEHYSKTEEYKKRTKQTCLKKYGCENIMEVDGIKEKIKQGYFDHYGVEHYAKSKEFYEKLPSTLQKIYNTKKQNHTFNSSSIEESFATWLTDNNIEFERQYRCDDYPFNCDFYIPSSKLFIEIQGSWTHGGHPYDPDNKDDKKELQKMIDKHSDHYDIAIDTWTVRDPLKRKTAHENNLNWIEVFTNDINILIENVKSKL